MPTPQSLLDAFPGLDVLVVGDALLDDYLYGDSLRIAREAPVPTVSVRERRAVPGGAANVAANVAALGARVGFLSVVGADPDGAALRESLRHCGVGVEGLLVDAGRQTVAKRRVVASGQMLVRFDEGGPAPLPEAVEEELVRRLGVAFQHCDALIVSDYGYGVLSDRVVDALRELQRRAPRVLVVDARSTDRYRHVGATAMKPNYDEVCNLLSRLPGAPGGRAAAVTERSGELLDATGANLVAVTLDRDGAVVCERDRPPYRTYSRPTADVRACGAGDSFTSGFALALAAGSDAPSAAELASAAAAVVIGRDGTATCSADDLRGHLADTTTRLEDRATLADQLAYQRRQGRRIVFTNGCFDLLHRGHVDLLNRAKALGDVLVVGLNSDESIRRLKGPGRPITRLADRAQVLAALSCVDHLATFDGQTAVELVELVRPDVYVKGGDYRPDMVPEAAYVERHGGTVQILPYLEDRSTSAIIERIRGAVPAVQPEARHDPYPEPVGSGAERR